MEPESVIFDQMGLGWRGWIWSRLEWAGVERSLRLDDIA